MRPLILHFCSFIALVPCLEGAVVQQDALIAIGSSMPYHSPVQDDLYFHLTQTAPPGNGMLLYRVTTPLPHNFTFSYLGIAEGNRLFLTEQADEFDMGFVTSNPSFATNYNTPGSGTFSLLPGQSRYLAYWDDRFFTEPDLFGWALLTNVGGELVVSDSATAVGGGIIVGTLQQIPEPTTGVALAATVMGAAMRRARPRRETT